MPRADGTQWERTLTMNEGEESALVTMARFFIDNGWIDDETQADFDTLIERYANPHRGIMQSTTQGGNNETLGQIRVHRVV